MGGAGRRAPPPAKMPGAGGPATAASTEPTSCSKSCDAKPTASPTTPTSKPAASSQHEPRRAQQPESQQETKAKVIVVGGRAAVTNDVRAAITEAAPSSTDVRRITGSTRTDTAARAARRILRTRTLASANEAAPGPSAARLVAHRRHFHIGAESYEQFIDTRRVCLRGVPLGLAPLSSADSGGSPGFRPGLSHPWV